MSKKVITGELEVGETTGRLYILRHRGGYDALDLHLINGKHYRITIEEL